jgi:hypothetical protein
MRSRLSLRLAFSAFALVSFSLLAMGADAPPSPASVVAPVDGYQVTTPDPANIAPTIAIPTKTPDVLGQPKNETEHPNLLWDQDEIDHYKAMLKTSKELQIQFDVMKAKVDARIAQPVEVPVPQKGADGEYPFIGDTLPPFPGAPATDDGPTKFRRWFATDGDIISDIATIYVLTGDEKYGDYAKQLLLAWAHCYEWGPVKNIKLRSGQGAYGFIFVEGLIMNHFAFAYDLIYNQKSWTAEERKQVHDDFFYPMADVALYPGAPDVDKDNAGGAFVTQITNRGMMALEGVYAAGVVTDDKQLIDAALYGVHTPLKSPDRAESVHFPPRQDWYAATPDNPGHGMLNTFFGEPLIPGGMYIGWHHGVDFYRNNNGIFKNMFDFSILLCYPDLTTPGLNDAHRATLLENPAPTLYEYAYRRYNDPRYLAMINPPEEKRFLAEIADPAAAAKVEDELLHPPPPPAPGTPPPPPPPPGTEKPPKSQRSLAIMSSKFGGCPPSFMYDLDPNAGATIVPAPSVNYPLVGFGIIRTPSVSGKYPQGVILSYGPTASHGHPDKLAIDVYALDDLLVPTPGIMFPYQNPLIPKWNHTTLAHNTLTVDEKSQDYFGDNPRSTARADQTVFAPASTVGMERAWTDSVYPGVTMDRALFMTPNYMADIFGAFSSAPHKYDLAWHIRGDVTSDLQLAPVTIDATVNGYNTLTNVRGADAADKPWTVILTNGDKVARLHVAGAAATQAIVGDGGIYVDDTSNAPHHLPTAPTILQRRDNDTSTIYGNALDFSNDKDGYVKNVAQEGSLEVGYAMLKVTTKAGTDLCFTAYRPGNYSADGLQTDGLQAFAQCNGSEPETLYLAGGKSLKVGDASLTRSASGLAYVEKTLEGNYFVGNASPSAATVTVTLPALQGLDAFAVDAAGVKGPPATNVIKSGATMTLQLPANAAVGFFKNK